MTDYEALGTGTAQHLHPYLCGRSEAMGVLDIVTTARRLFPGEIGKRFAIVGHSQGGQAALFAAHHAPGRSQGSRASARSRPPITSWAWSGPEPASTRRTPASRSHRSSSPVLSAATPRSTRNRCFHTMRSSSSGPTYGTAPAPD
ncbi:hypothetical protein [Streptomyces sp. NPDC058011]|uniref:hypothetical protein n=1 Tax=Streptomyces sp. NPDC058011 TaxID=3346305 RepID=UPI0036E4C2C9